MIVAEADCPTSTSPTATPANGAVVALSVIAWVGAALDAVGASLTLAVTTLVFESVVGELTTPSVSLIVKVVETVAPGVTWFCVGVNTAACSAAVTDAAEPVTV